MSNVHSATIPMKEYEELRNIQREIYLAFRDKAILLYHTSQFYGPSGYPAHTFSIINESDAMGALTEEITRLREDNAKLYKENLDLQQKKGRRFLKLW